MKDFKFECPDCLRMKGASEQEITRTPPAVLRRCSFHQNPKHRRVEQALKSHLEDRRRRGR